MLPESTLVDHLYEVTVARGLAAHAAERRGTVLARGAPLAALTLDAVFPWGQVYDERRDRPLPPDEVASLLGGLAALIHAGGRLLYLHRFPVPGSATAPADVPGPWGYVAGAQYEVAVTLREALRGLREAEHWDDAVVRDVLAEFAGSYCDDPDDRAEAHVGALLAAFAAEPGES